MPAPGSAGSCWAAGTWAANTWDVNAWGLAVVAALAKVITVIALTLGITL